tara:strand:- start:28 stop:318 length:291 start_codon:yes stop_codon:yes gene_type:complete
MKKIKEEIARSRSTHDTDPVQWYDHPDLSVEYGANDNGSWSVKVSSKSQPHLNYSKSGIPDEESAKFQARKFGELITRTTINELRLVIRSLILDLR